jgi:pimeloyl-ACP methyl ester carboxylesterase
MKIRRITADKHAAARLPGKTAKSTAATIITAVLLIPVVFCIHLLLVSKGWIQPLTDAPNGIAEKATVEINGVPQGMFIRGKDCANPVLLFIHGGPGVPEFFLNEQYETDLENHFTVCWWEERGACLSYSRKLAPETITTQQLIDDTTAVSRYLCNRFGKQKIYLMAHSFGTYIGIRAAAAHPELYYAYIGMAQYVSGGRESKLLTCKYMQSVFKERGDYRALKRLAGCISSGHTIPDSLIHKAGCGTMHKMDSVITGIFFPQLNSRCYTAGEKIKYWKGKIFMQSCPVDAEFRNSSLTDTLETLSIPVYFLSGIYDYTCPWPLSKSYLETLDAPVKKFYLFKQSAHSPLWEEPEKTVGIMLNEVLKGRTPAD